MRVNLKKRLTALMMAGMMVTSNVLPAYSATETTASDYVDRDGEAEEHTEKAEHSAEKTEEKDTSVKSSDEKTSDAKSAEQKSDDTASEEKSGKDDTASEKKDDVKEEKQDEKTEEKSDSSASSDAKDTEKTDAAAKADASEKKEHASKDAEETAASEKDSTEKTDSETEAKEETTASEETAAAETTEETKAASGASGVAGTGVKIEETTASEETTEAETTAAEETTAAAETTAPVEVIEANADTASSSDIRKSLTLQVRFIDEDGNALPDRENAELSIKGDLDLTKSPRAVRGYTYVEARLGDLVLTKITRVKDAENDEVSYAYTAKDGTTGSIDDGTTLDLVYTKNDRKSIYTYIGDGIKVTAKLEKAAAIPDDASLRVVELSDGQLYDAYIAAMDEADPDLEHTKTNTILWDIAFIATDDEGQELEYEPSEGSVKVSIEYLNDTLEQKLGVSDVSEVKTYHLPLADGVKAEGEKTIDVQDVASSDINVEKLDSTADGDKTVEVEMDSFSVMAQTVDGTEYLVDDEPLDLTKIANENITVTVETTGELDRNATFDLGLSFKVDDQRLADTVKTDSGDGKVYHNVWVYDLSSVLKNAPIALVNGINGDLFDGVAKVGTYSVSDGKITLKIEPEFLAAHTSDVQGSFRFQAKLEKEKLSTDKEYIIRFPGSATDTVITVKEVNASSWKNVNEGTGDQYLKPNADGSYTLHYAANFNADAGLTTLTLRDTLTGEQSFDQTSFRIEVNGTTTAVPSSAMTFAGKSVTIDVLSALGITKTTASQNYKISYTTTFSASALNTELKNSAKWSWDGGKETGPNEQTITPHKKLDVKKNVDENNGVYTYTITVGGADVDMQGHVIKDWMSDNQVLDGNITISPDVNGNSTISPTWSDDGKYSDSDVELFTFTFPTDKEYKGVYTITYETKLANVDWTGDHYIKNTTNDEHDGDKGSASTSKKHNFGVEKKANIEKTWTAWDEANKAVKWSVSVSLPDGLTSLDNVVVKDFDAEYKAQSGSKTQMDIDLSEITITDESGATLTKGSDYTINNDAKTITFSKLTEKVIISGIITKSAYDYANTDKEYVEFWNTASVTVDGKNEQKDTANQKYSTSNWSMSKEGEFNKEDNTVTWTVKINKNKLAVSPDVPLIFKDTIPDGMELVGDLTVTSAGDYHGSLTISPSDKKEINVNITQEFKDQNQWYYLNGISGNYVVITYKTKLTEAAAADKTNWTAKYKNVASVVGEDGTELKRAEKEIKVDYKVITKQDTSDKDLASDLITYKIVINPDGLDLNGGNELTLTDVLPEGTSFVSNGYSFDPSIASAKVSLNSATRTLTVKVPDKQKVTFTYQVKSIDLHTDGQKFKNTVELTGKTKYTDSEEKEHVIKRHSGGLSGAKDSIFLSKYDEDDTSKYLAGAEFRLDELSIAANGTMSVTNEGAQRETTNANGKIEFTHLTPVNNGENGTAVSSAPYRAYRVVETKAPDDYEIDAQYKNGYYFIFHMDDSGSKAEEVKTLADGKNQDADGNDITFAVLPGAATISISNKKKAEVGSLEFTKSFEGDTISEADKNGISFKVTGPNGYEKTVTLGSMEQEDGTYKAVLKNLAVGDYTVVEDGADVAGYTVTTSYKVGATATSTVAVETNKTSSMAITNTYTQKVGILEFTKSFAGDTISEADKNGISFKVTGPNGYEKTVTLGSMEQEDGTYKAVLKNLAVGDYTVVEDGADVAGYTVTTSYKVGATATSTVAVETNKTSSMAITNTYTQKVGILEFTKSFAGDTISEADKNGISFKVTGPNGYEKTVTLGSMEQEDGTYKAVLKNLAVGDYTVVEDGADVAGYTVTTSYKVGATATSTVAVETNKTSSMAITNTYTQKVGILEFTKSFAGDAISEADKNGISFKVTGPNGYEKTVTLGSMEQEDGTYKAVLKNLAVGDYTVVEDGADVAGYTVTTSYKVGATATSTVAVETNKTSSMAITNTYTQKVGILEFTKSFAGDAISEADKNGISFKVTGPNGYEKTVTLGSMEQEDGTYEAVLKNLAVGDYTVVEDGADVAGYTVTTSYKVGATATSTVAVETNKTSSMAITNTYTQNVGSLEFTKSFAGHTVTAEDEEKIIFTVTGPNSYTKTIKLGDMKQGDGTYKASIENLPVGKYTVSENANAVANYTRVVTYEVNGNTTTAESATVTISNGATTTAAITNTYTQDVGSLEFTKSFAGHTVTAEDEEKIIFTVTGPNSYTKTIKLGDMKQGDGTYKASIENLPVGKYTVSENANAVANYTRVVTYEVNGKKTTAESATVTISNGATTTAAITNTYTQDVGSLEFTKSFAGHTVTAEDEEKIIFTVTGPNSYTKTIKLGDMKQGDGTYKASIENLPVGKYTVSENANAVANYTRVVTYEVNGKKTTAESATVTISNGATTTAAITNTYTQDVGSLEFTKSFAGHTVTAEDEEKIIFTVTGPNSYTKTIKLGDMKQGDGTYKTSIENLPVGKYTVSENANAVANYTRVVTYEVNGKKTTAESATVTISDGATTTAEITNTYTQDVGSLEFTKSFAGHTVTAEDEEKIIFTVTGPNSYTKTIKLGDMKQGDGTYKASIENLPVGKYTVSENANAVANYTRVVTYEVNGKKTTAESATVTISDGATTTAEITNTYTQDVGSLEFTKSFAGHTVTAEDEEKIIFTVTGPNSYTKTIKLGDMKQGDGTYKASIENLPVGKYTVSENANAVANYTRVVTYKVNGKKTTAESATVTISDGATTTAEITNTYTQDVGSLEFTKSFAGHTVTAEDEEKIIFTVTGPNSYTKTIKLGDMKQGDGTYKASIENLPVGKYTVSENANAVANYTRVVTYTVNGNTTTAESATVTISNGATTTAAITNTYTQDVGSLEFTKSFAGHTVTAEDEEKIIFTVTGPNSYTKTIKLGDMKQGDGTYKASIENLPVGKYTVSENANAVANYTRVVTYEVNGKKTTAESATVTISNGATTTAEITNTYTYVDHEVEISKTDINGAELAGAKLQVTVADTGEVVDAWTSGTETHKVTVKPGTYVLHESGAPENYVVASDIRFTVDENGKVTVAGEDAAKVTMVDDYTEHSVTISKRNIGGTEIAGAKLRVTDESGAAVQEWTSAAAEHSFTVKPGTYVLHEDAAPNGYKVANDITFTVSVDGTVTVDGKSVDKVIMIDYRTGGNGGGGGGGGNHPGVPVETTTAAETTPAETTTEAAETTTAQDTPETDEYGNVIGANRNKKKPDDGDDGTTKGAGRNKAKTGDDSMMPFFGLGFFGSLMALLGWVGIRFTKREH